MTLNRPLRAYLAQTFTIDLRTLALFRAALGAVLFVSLLMRLADVGAFYADSGVMPRAWLLQSESPLRWSLHFANGSALFEAALLLIHAAAAFALMVGSHTRLAAITTWVLLVSLHGRNPLVLIGGDYLLVCLLFWGLFLPLGARWSVDAALSTQPPREDREHLSWASAGLVLQVLSVYFFSAIMKADPAWWPDGTAVEQALRLDRYTLPLGYWLRDTLPAALRPLTYYVYWLELLGPLLALSPVLQRPLRFAVLLMLFAMHLGFVLCLKLGLFPFASAASLTVLLGGWAWDSGARRLDRGRHLKIYYDRDCAFCLKSCLLFRTFLALPHCEIAPAQDSVRIHTLMQARNSWVVVDPEDVAHTKWDAFVALLRESPLFGWTWRLAKLSAWQRPGDAVYDFVARHRGAFGRVSGVLWPMRAPDADAPRWAQGIAGVAVVAVLAYNLVTVQALPRAGYTALAPVLYPLRLDQAWSMFAPQPSRDDGWFVAPGTLADGSEVDVLHPDRGGVGYGKPARMTDEYGNFRWAALLTRLQNREFRHHRLPLAKYLCREWNRDADPERRLLTFKLVFMLERTLPDLREAPLEQVVLWYHDCSSPEPARDGAAAPGPTDPSNPPRRPADPASVPEQDEPPSPDAP